MHKESCLCYNAKKGMKFSRGITRTAIELMTSVFTQKLSAFFLYKKQKKVCQSENSDGDAKKACLSESKV